MSMFFFMLPIIILGGFMFPVANMPVAFQWLSLLDPLRHYLEMVRGIFLKGAGLAALWTQLLALAVMGPGLLWFAVTRFHKTIRIGSAKDLSSQVVGRRADAQWFAGGSGRLVRRGRCAVGVPRERRAAARERRARGARRQAPCERSEPSEPASAPATRASDEPPRFAIVVLPV